MAAKFKIKKDDQVIVVAGKFKGMKGTVQEVVTAKNKVVVTGVNVVKKHFKARSAEEQSRIISKEMPIHISNVALFDKNGKPSKVGFKLSDDGKKQRFLKTTGDLVS